MKSPAEDVADYLDQQNVATRGVDLYVSREPSRQDRTVVTIFDDGGGQPDPRHAWDQYAIVVRVRAVDYPTAYDHLWSLRDALLGLARTTINDRDYKVIYAVGEPAPLGYNVNSRPALNQGFEAFAVPPAGMWRA